MVNKKTKKTNKISKISMVKRKTIKEKSEGHKVMPMVVIQRASYVKSIILDKIKFTQKEIINMSALSQQSHLNVKWVEAEPHYEYRGYISNFPFDGVTIQLNVNDNKLNKLLKLFEKNTQPDKKGIFKPVPANIMTIEKYNPDSKTTTTFRTGGRVTAIANGEECAEFTFRTS